MGERSSVDVERLEQNKAIEEALIVTTPQEIFLAAVRKSINFCSQVNMKVAGVIENMSGFACPHCSEKISSAKLQSKRHANEFSRTSS